MLRKPELGGLLSRGAYWILLQHFSQGAVLDQLKSCCKLAFFRFKLWFYCNIADLSVVLQIASFLIHNSLSFDINKIALFAETAETVSGG